VRQSGVGPATHQGRAIITGDAAYVAELNVATGVPSGYWVTSGS
jgi:hypothetical protein